MGEYVRDYNKYPVKKPGARKTLSPAEQKVIENRKQVVESREDVALKREQEEVWDKPSST